MESILYAMVIATLLSCLAISSTLKVKYSVSNFYYKESLQNFEESKQTKTVPKHLVYESQRNYAEYSD